MEEFDQIIKKKLEGRTIAPSSSAWERMSEQLDKKESKNSNKLFWYIGYAASILLLVSLFFISNRSDVNAPVTPENIIVDTPVEKEIIFEPSTIKEPVETKSTNSQVLVANKVPKKAKPTKKSSSVKKSKVLSKSKLKVEDKIDISVIQEDSKIAVVHEIEKIKDKEPNSLETIETLKMLKQNPNSRIKINSDALLYAVTHNPLEVKEYYAKYNVNREDALQTIKIQLKNENLKINPETILAEVEKTIEEDDFQNNFLNFLKKRVSDITTALASRNK